MALFKYVGPYDSVSVSVAGNDLGIVKNGESVAVPDELAQTVEWPEDHWQSAGDSNESLKPGLVEARNDTSEPEPVVAADGTENDINSGEGDA